MKLANEFIKFVVKELGMKSLPKNIKFVGEEYSVQHMTFGTYNPTLDEVVIVKGNRHPVDVLRTLAHELVHHKQREDGKTLDGNDGSEIENEANAKAGELMRKFRKVVPEVFNVGAFGFHTNMETKLDKIKHAAATGEPQKVDEHYVDAFTANLILTVTNNLSSEKHESFLNESVDRMVAIAYKMVTK